MPTDTARQLKDLYPALQGMDPQLLESVLERQAQRLTVPAGAMLFDEGSPCRGFPLVLSGAVRDLSTRFIDRSVHASLIMTLSAAAVTLAALCVAPFGGWISPEAILVAKVAGAAVFSLGGQLGVIVAMRSGEVLCPNRSC